MTQGASFAAARPVLIDDVRQAAARLASRARRTPVFTVRIDGRPVTLKLEFMQVTGTFKFRGAFNAIAAAAGAERVITASGGNHGLAVATAARLLGLPATVYVPHGTPEVKRRRISAAGAEVVVQGRQYAEAETAARAAAAQPAGPGEPADPGPLYLHAYNDPAVIAGQGTVGLEIIEQAPETDVVVVAVGGGGLAAGVGAAIGTERTLVAVEPVNCDCLHRAYEAGAPVEAPTESVAASALGASRIGDRPFAMLRHRPVELVHVTDAEILAARDRLWEDLRIAVEPAAAAPFAAWLADRVPGHRPCLVLCGANDSWTPGKDMATAGVEA
jgi:threonine dehydratase